MKRENRQNILLRYAFILIFILLMAAAIVYKLIDNTVISAPEWNKKAMAELSRTETIQPERGNILASDGSVLATSLWFYTVRIDYRAEKFAEDTLRKYIAPLSDSLAKYFPVRNSKQWRAHLLKPLSKPNDKRSRHHKVMSNLSESECDMIARFPFFNVGKRSGMIREKFLKRINPYGDMARRSIGGVGATKENKEVHGISGLEKALDSLLYGKAGVAKKVPLTRKITNWVDTPAVNGFDIRTTIDIKMQDIVENELNKMLEFCNADWGVAVLMDVPTGDIKAISNLEKNPDGAGYIEGMNRAVLGYEPGSVVKTISMLLALEDGIVTNVNEVIPTGRSWAYAGGRPITDAHGVDAVTVGGVIESSSNIGMAKIITRRYDSHPGGFYSRLKEIGFLEPMNTGIAGERVPRVDSVPSDRGGRIALSRQSYGYATEIPPLYTLSVYNAIANGGKYVRPRLVSGLVGADIDTVFPVTYIRQRICSETNAEKLRNMLTSVVWGDHGTGRRLRDKRVAIAGKTGTCYMIDNGAYNTSRKRLAFCGFFPAEAPKYSCIVLTAAPKQNAMGAASTSGEVLKNVALKMYSRGMLGPGPNYRSGEKSAPTMYASHDKHSQSCIAQNLNIAQHHVLRNPKKVKKGVPDVHGFGVREAILELEKAGYNARFSGTGYVAGQYPSPGSNATAGAVVHLKLKE
ncbi:MAG: transpeptidase family protein [Paramuribaculum sp.]|nr:transpeptidase family protein [Paramuribaculum sp.]